MIMLIRLFQEEIPIKQYQKKQKDRQSHGSLRRSEATSDERSPLAFTSIDCVATHIHTHRRL